MERSLRLNFRVIIANILGVRKFRTFTVFVTLQDTAKASDKKGGGMMSFFPKQSGMSQNFI